MSKSITRPVRLVAGIDVSKATLDLVLSDGSGYQLEANDAAGHGRLIAALRARGVSAVGLEASGGYEKVLVRALRGAGLVVSVFQPLQVRAFAKSRGVLAKTDKIDALILALFLLERGDLSAHVDPRLEPLAEALTYLEQLEEDRDRAKTRREGFRDKTLIRRIEAALKRCEAAVRRQIARLQAALQAYPDLAERCALLQTIPGLGLRSAITLVIRMPELGSMSREQAVSLAGLAPHPDDSGTRRGLRYVHAGRSRVRTALFKAAAMASLRWNPALIAFRSRLQAANKPYKVTILACARKLIVYANAVLERASPWSPDIPTNKHAS